MDKRDVDARCWLDVPFSENRVARVAGAAWDDSARRWYAPHGQTPALERWRALPEVPDLLPGEHRGFGAGLFVDLVPKSCWFTNARSCIAEVDWERVRRMAFRRAMRRCEACGVALTPTEASWEVHERWEYDQNAVDGHVQRLRRLLVLCRPCHHATHFGLATVTHTSEEALCHLMKVNIWTRAEASTHVRAAHATWKKRSELDWKLDLGILTGAGIRVAMPPNAANRRTFSAEHRKRGPNSG